MSIPKPPPPIAPTTVRKRKVRYYDELAVKPPLHTLKNRFVDWDWDSERQPKSENAKR